MTYSELKEEAKDILTEFDFTSRWMKIEGYHRIGRLIIENNVPAERFESLAKYLNISTRNLSTAIILANQYPDLNALPVGKDINWNTIGDYLETKK